jgi:hypothetical protein
MAALTKMGCSPSHKKEEILPTIEYCQVATELAFIFDVL